MFNFVDNTIEVLSAPRRTLYDLARLSAILRDAREHGLETEEIQQRIADEVPELSGLASLLPKTRTELYAFIALILTVITILQAAGASRTTNITSSQVMNQTFTQNTTITVPTQRPKETTSPAPKSKPGRNDPCPCGSGVKYKKCCGSSR